MYTLRIPTTNYQLLPNYNNYNYNNYNNQST